MTTKQFEKILTHSIHRKKLVFGKKQVEYSRHENVFHNFDRAAAILGITREQALLGMAVKHLVSILDMVDAVAAGRKLPQKWVDEKMGDWDVYMSILEGQLTEHRG